ncbi:MAG TPA: methyltransferase domain-containing protein [Candidatus Binataceae bacterium]|nr:methyltransferase domain-containing protein [Candidatus Binataceae bacterium]
MAVNGGNPAEYSHFSRSVIDSIERWSGVIHRRRRFTPAAQIVKVNLGSGLQVAPGWINVDGSLRTLAAGHSPFVIGLVYRFLTDHQNLSRDEFVALLSKNTFVHYDLKYGVPLPDSSADFIFTSHSLHHLYRDKAQALLADALRVLKAGGTIRIAVPNLEYIFSLYQRGEREHALKYFFYPSEPRNQLSWRHYQYDFELMRQMLEGAGYDKVRRCAYRQGRTPDLELLDNRPHETLFVEADKPLEARDELDRAAATL